MKTINTQIDRLLFEQELAKADLTAMWQFIESTNPGKDNSYHNNEHMYQVANLALKLLRLEPEFIELPLEKRNLHELICLLACLWHDYDHSAGVHPDYVNVRQARDHFKRYWDEHGRDHKYLREAGLLEPGANKPLMAWLHVGAKVDEVIKVTEYSDGRFPHVPFDAIQSAVRDADILYTFCSDTIGIVTKLYIEMQHKLPDGMTLETFCEGNKAFHAKVIMHTKAGSIIHREMVSEVLETQARWAPTITKIAAEHTG